jgi:Peptidase family M23
MSQFCDIESCTRDWCKMRIHFALAIVLMLASGASAEEDGRPTAIIVSPIHEAQVVRGDDGMDHIEYELLVVSVFSEPVTLSSVTVLDLAGKELLRIDGGALAAATQTLFAKTQSPVIPASAAVSVDVDLILPGTAPARVTHRIAYTTLKVDSGLAPMVRDLEVDAPEVAVNRQRAIVIRPPLAGDGWLATSACCKPNLHRDERVAIDGVRIETGETFAVDWAKVKNDRLFDGDGKKVEQFYGFGEDVLAVADGVVVSVHDGMPDQTPFVLMVPKSKADYGGNNVMLRVAPNVFAWYAHLRQDSITVKVGEVLKAGAPIAQLGNTGPSEGPHLHLGLLDKPDPIAGRSLPFVFDSFTLVGAVDFAASKEDKLIIARQSRQVRFAYPLYGGVQIFSELRP